MEYNYINTTSLGEAYGNNSYEYVIDNMDLNMDLNMPICNEFSSEINEINKIRNGISNIMNNIDLNDMNASDTCDDNFKELSEMIDNFKKEYINEQEKYNLCEKEFNDAINESKQDLKKLDLITKFMIELGEKDCKDQLNETIISNLKELSKKIENKDKIVIAKNKYIESKIRINKYLNLIKKINGLNISNTCPLCLTDTVSVYLNPCGHTCCDKCYEKICTNNNNKCFLCRNRILNKAPLYFS